MHYLGNFWTTYIAGPSKPTSRRIFLNLTCGGVITNTASRQGLVDMVKKYALDLHDALFC